VPSYVSRLESRQHVAGGTLEIRLQKPPEFRFRAGQYADVVLIDPPFRDIGGNLRTFSILSAPFQTDLEFVMRLSNTAFKRVLDTMAIGTPLNLLGPAGEFQLHDDPTRPAVLLAGGVGIAPFISILRQAHHDGLKHSVYLFYSNRQSADIAYLPELRTLVSTDPLHFHFIPTISGTAEAKWPGETGRIDAAMLRRHIPPRTRPMYYIAGPSQFAGGMISVLTANDVGESDVKVEDFGEL